MRKLLLVLAVALPIGGVLFSVLHKKLPPPPPAPVVVTTPADVWYPEPATTVDYPAAEKPSKPKARKVASAPKKLTKRAPYDLTPPPADHPVPLPMVKCLLPGFIIQLCTPVTN